MTEQRLTGGYVLKSDNPYLMLDYLTQRATNVLDAQVLRRLRELVTEMDRSKKGD